MSEDIHQPQSQFVTGLAWFTIGGSGLSLLGVVGVVGYIALAVGLRGSEALLALASTLAFAAPALICLVAGIGLLQRMNWARILMVFILAIFILGSILLYLFFGPNSGTEISVGAGETGLLVVETGSAAYGIGVLLLLGFCAHKLTTPEIKKEFGA